MAGPHSKEEASEAGPRGSEARARKKSQEQDHPHHPHHRPEVPDDADLHWHRRELQEGWRQPKYEAYYDESSARERAALPEEVSTESSPGTPKPREAGAHSSDDFWEIPGPESGKGPKGYRQSDLRLYEEVCERLSRHGQLDARGIKVSCEKGEITLRGSVNDEESKRIAEACARSVSGVRKVRNKLKFRIEPLLEKASTSSPHA